MSIIQSDTPLTDAAVRAIEHNERAVPAAEMEKLERQRACAHAFHRSMVAERDLGGRPRVRWM
mgnify:CR=1 FL=1